MYKRQRSYFPIVEVDQVWIPLRPSVFCQQRSIRTHVHLSLIHIYINKMGDPEYMKFLPNGEDKNADYGTPRIKSPKEMIDYVHKQNAHIMISVWASFGPWTEMYQKMDSLKALLHFETWPPKAGVKPYDPYNPAARDIYWEAMKKNIFDLGMDAWWLDSTEPDHMDIKDQDFNTQTYLGSFRRVHNAFPLMSNKGVYEHLSLIHI